jgi:hypothetical protein
MDDDSLLLLVLFFGPSSFFYFDFSMAHALVRSPFFFFLSHQLIPRTNLKAYSLLSQQPASQPALCIFSLHKKEEEEEEEQK